MLSKKWCVIGGELKEMCCKNDVLVSGVIPSTVVKIVGQDWVKVILHHCCLYWSIFVWEGQGVVKEKSVIIFIEGVAEG